MADRIAHPIFGYTMNMGDELYDAFHAWCIDRYDWRIDREALHTALGLFRRSTHSPSTCVRRATES
jgi:cystathionine beta-lyase